MTTPKKTPAPKPAATVAAVIPLSQPPAGGFAESIQAVNRTALAAMAAGAQLRALRERVAYLKAELVKAEREHDEAEKAVIRATTDIKPMPGVG